MLLTVRILIQSSPFEDCEKSTACAGTGRHGLRLLRCCMGEVFVFALRPGRDERDSRSMYYVEDFAANYLSRSKIYK